MDLKFKLSISVFPLKATIQCAYSLYASKLLKWLTEAQPEFQPSPCPAKSQEWDDPGGGLPYETDGDARRKF